MSRITQRLLDGLKPTGRDQFYRDGELRGFGVKVTTAGSVSFIAEGRIRGGKSKRVKLGAYPTLSLTEAREKAKDALRLLHDGLDPIEEQKRHREQREAHKAKEEALSVTLEDLLDRFYEARSLKPKTEYDYQNTVKNCFSDWLTLPVRKITRKMVEDKFGEIQSNHGRSTSESGKAQAVKAMRILSSVLNYGMGEDVDGERLLTDNPVEVLKRRRGRTVKPRTNSVNPQDLWKVLDALDARESHPVKDWLKLLLFTGIRREEGLSLTWDQVDFEKHWFVLTDTKNGLDHVVPMSDLVEELLTARKNQNDRLTEEKRSTWVFPSPGNRKLHVREPRTGIQRVVDDSTVEFTAHDLRRTFASIAHLIGLDHTTIKRVMNHKQKDITELYIQTRTEQLRKPMQEIADYIRSAYIEHRSNWLQENLGQERWDDYYWNH